MDSYSKHYNTIVIGIGGMGSATVYELAKRTQPILIGFLLNSRRVSTHGRTRKPQQRHAHHHGMNPVPVIKKTC